MPREWEGICKCKSVLLFISNIHRGWTRFSLCQSLYQKTNFLLPENDGGLWVRVERHFAFCGWMRRWMWVVRCIYSTQMPEAPRPGRISINTSALTVPDRPWFTGSHLGLSTEPQPFCGLSCHWVRRCTEAAISPISQIMAGKYQLVFYPTVNKDKYQRAAQPSQLPPTQYFWWAIRCPGHVLLRFNRLIWINSHLSDSGDRGSINISAPLWLLSQNGAKVSTVCYTCYTLLLSWWNPSRSGLTTKPLASHLQGSDSPTPTAQNCTFHRAEKSVCHTKKDKLRGGEWERERKGWEGRGREKENRAPLAHKHTRISNIQVRSMMSVHKIAYFTLMVVNPIFFSTGTGLLLLVLSERCISPSTPSEWQHL